MGNQQLPFDAQDVRRVLGSPEGQKILKLLSRDGGRALRCALLSRWTPEQADSVSRWVSLGVGGIMAVLAVYAACGLHLGLWAALAAGLFLWRMLNCIQREPR